MDVLGAWLLKLLTMGQDRPHEREMRGADSRDIHQFFYFHYSMSVCFSLEGEQHKSPPTPGETLPLPDVLFPQQPCLSYYGQECRRNFLCLTGAGPVGAMSERERAEKPLIPWGGWQVSALPALCLHGWNFPGSSPSATTITLQIPRNATHENAFLAHSWHGQHLLSKESAVRDFKLLHCGKKLLGVIIDT